MGVTLQYTLKTLSALTMSSFFSKFRTSKKKGQNLYPDSTHSANSNNSSQVSLASKSHTSLPQGRVVPPPTTHKQAPKSPHRSGTKPTSYISKNPSADTNGTNSSRNAMQMQPAQPSQPPQPTPLFLKKPYVRAALVKGSFQTIVELPRYVDLNEWLALNLFEFNSNVAQFVSLVSDYIDDSHKMSAGPGYDYLWIDTNKQAIRLPAVTYIDYTMSWITSKFDDPALFPTKQGVPFPPVFGAAVKSIYVQLFRIFAYLTHHHYDKVVHLGLEPHFNSLFCHFASFGKTFNLLDRNEMAPLLPFIKAFEVQGKIV